MKVMACNIILLIIGLSSFQKSYGFLPFKHATQMISKRTFGRNDNDLMHSKMVKPLLMNVKIDTDISEREGFPAVSIGQFIKSFIIDRNTVRSSLVSQSVLMITALAFGIVFHVDVVDFSTMGFDFYSMWLATQFGLGALGNRPYYLLIFK